MASDDEKRLRWELIEPAKAGAGNLPQEHQTFRAKVPGGWLVSVWASSGSMGDAMGGGLAFVPDVDHLAWKDLPVRRS